jgi:DNA polymerase-3 subunit delta
MTDPGPPPVVYLLLGEDEFSISEFVADLRHKLGDPAAAEFNTNQLDGRSVNLEQIREIANSMPFLSRRRLVVLNNPLARVTTPKDREKFISMLERLPDTTALVLIEYKILTTKKERQDGRVHWLEKWAAAEPERAFMRFFSMPKGDALVEWIFNRAKALGGRVSRTAASTLAELVGEEPRLLDHEIQKLITYVNNSRPVEAEDVYLLTANTSQANIFRMVDALVDRDSRRAMGQLHRLLDEQEAISILGMVVRQFRMLIQAREIIEGGGSKADILRLLRIPPFVAESLYRQARGFSLQKLEEVYHDLLATDTSVKTGQAPGDLALELFVGSFTERSSAK